VNETKSYDRGYFTSLRRFYTPYGESRPQVIVLSEKTVSRRGYVKYAGAGIVIVAGAAAGAYYATRPPPTPAETTTMATATGPKEWSDFYKEAAAPYKGTKLQVISVSGQRLEDTLISSGQEFEKLTGISVEVTPLSWDAGHEKVVSDYVAKAGAYDGATIDGWVMANFTQSGYLVPQDQFWNNSALRDPNFNFDDLVPSIVDLNCTWQNEWWGLPYIGDVSVLFYRKDLFDKYDMKPPETWDEYTQTAKFFAKDVFEQEHVYGSAEQLKMGIDCPTSWVYRYGGPFDQYHPVVNNKYGKQAFQWTKDVLPYSAPATLEYDSMESGDAFLRGDVAMNPNWGFLAGKAVDPTMSKIQDKWFVAPVPKGLEKRTPFLGGWVLGILPYSKRKEAAFLFFEYHSTQQNQKRVVLDPSLGSVPTRTSVLSDPDVVAKFPYYPAYVESLLTSVARPSVPEFLEMWDVLSIAFSDYLTNAKGLDEATDWCQAKWEELLA